jgi:formate hydrogenlyase subunit 3/multisubunit Na+/H+ antiporter MnhD subunit
VNTAYLLAIICLGLAAGSLFAASKQKDKYDDTSTVGMVLIMMTVGFLFGAGLFALMGLDLQYPGFITG